MTHIVNTLSWIFLYVQYLQDYECILVFLDKLKVLIPLILVATQAFL